MKDLLRIIYRRYWKAQSEDSMMDYEGRLERFYGAYFLQLIRGLPQGGIANHVAIDVGAHAGRHTFPLAVAVGNKGIVYALEAQPHYASKIARVAKICKFADRSMGDVKVLELAASNEKCVTEFTLAIDRLGESGLLPREIFGGPTRLRKISVRTDTLDNIFVDLGRLDFIKIDVEGAEYWVLQGAEKLLSKHQPIIAFEFGMAAAGAYKVVPEDVFHFLESLGYGVLNILGDQVDDAQAFAESSTIQALWDYVAVPRIRLDDVRSLLKV